MPFETLPIHLSLTFPWKTEFLFSPSSVSLPKSIILPQPATGWDRIEVCINCILKPAINSLQWIWMGRLNSVKNIFQKITWVCNNGLCRTEGWHRMTLIYVCFMLGHHSSRGGVESFSCTALHRNLFRTVHTTHVHWTTPWPSGPYGELDYLRGTQRT